MRCANRKIEHSTFGRRCESTCLISTGKGYKSWAAYNPKVSRGDNWYFHSGDSGFLQRTPSASEVDSQYVLLSNSPVFP